MQGRTPGEKPEVYRRPKHDLASGYLGSSDSTVFLEQCAGVKFIFLIMESSLCGNLATRSVELHLSVSSAPCRRKVTDTQSPQREEPVLGATGGPAGSLPAWLLTDGSFTCHLKGLVSEPCEDPSAGRHAEGGQI